MRQKLATESPIEALLLGYLELMPPEVELRTQVPIAADRNYRVDFWLRRGDGTAVVECDGREFHDYADDRRRDLDILKHGRITDILRFKGTDIHFFPAECMDHLNKMLPFLFGSQRLDNKEKSLRLASLKSVDIQPIYRGLNDDGIPIEFVPPGWKERASSPRIPTIADCIGQFFQDVDKS